MKLNLISSVFNSPKTTLGGLCALVGAVLMLINKPEAGMALIGIGAALTGALARDNDKSSEIANTPSSNKLKPWKR